jgi:hypothetical protein
MRNRTFHALSWLSTFTVATAVLALAGWAAEANGFHLLARAAVATVFVYGTVDIVRFGLVRNPARNRGYVMRAVFRVVTTMLFTAWAGWVTTAGVTDANTIGFLVGLGVLATFTPLLTMRPDLAHPRPIPADEVPADVPRPYGYPDVTIRLVDIGGPAREMFGHIVDELGNGPLPEHMPRFEVHIAGTGVTTMLGRDATAASVAEFVEEAHARWREVRKAP